MTRAALMPILRPAGGWSGTIQATQRTRMVSRRRLLAEAAIRIPSPPPPPPTPTVPTPPPPTITTMVIVTGSA